MMRHAGKAWRFVALAAGVWALLLAGVGPAGAAEKKAAAAGDDAATTGTGVTVTGQVKVTGAPGGFDLTDCVGALNANVKRPQPPEEVLKQGREALQKWFQEWLKTPEGQAQYRLSRFNKMFTIEKDGRFQIPNIPPGKYILRIGAFETTEAPGAPGKPKEKVKTGEILAQTSKAFEISAQAGKPLDLGTIELALPKVPQVGDLAPDFKVPTLDGKTISLKDYRGKVVLLDFWATWCGPCRAELPNIKAAYDKFGKNPKFVLISLSLDNEIAAPQDYVKQNGMDWKQGFLGNWAEDPVTKEYGVNGIPAMFLIDPEGKIIAKGLRGERISLAVGRALGRKPAEEKGGKAGKATNRKK